MVKVFASLVLLGVILNCGCALDVCDGQKNGSKLLHPADCAKYIVCGNDGISAITKCPNGKHFNRLQSRCDTKESAGCPLQQSGRELFMQYYCESCSSVCGPLPPRPPLVPQNPPCTDEKPTPSTPCPLSSTPSTPCPLSSTPTRSTPCPLSSTPTPSTPCALSSTPTPSTSCPLSSTPSSPTNKPGPLTGPSGISCEQSGKCHNQPDGTVLSNDANQNSYFVCQCQCEILRHCPGGLVFNDQLQTCAFPNSSDMV